MLRDGVRITLRVEREIVEWLNAKASTGNLSKVVRCILWETMLLGECDAEKRKQQKKGSSGMLDKGPYVRRRRRSSR